MQKHFKTFWISLFLILVIFTTARSDPDFPIESISDEDEGHSQPNGPVPVIPDNSTWIESLFKSFKMFSNTVSQIYFVQFLNYLSESFEYSLIPFIKGLIGFLTVILSIILHWFNEKKTADMNRIVKYGEGACEEVPSLEYNTELNGELVYMSGKVSTGYNLHDQTFGVHLSEAVKLKRVVEVYQATEVKLNKRFPFQKQQYKYENVWCEYLNPSELFHTEEARELNKHVKFIAHDMVFTSPTVELGSFKLTPFQIKRLDRWSPLYLDGNAGTVFSRDLKEKINNLGWKKQHIHIAENVLRISQGDGEKPDIGDIKVSFYQIPCDYVSVVAEQAGISFKPYNIKERRFLKKSDIEKITLIDEEELRFEQSVEKGLDSCCWGAFCCWTATRNNNPMKVKETIDWIYPGQISKKDFFTNQIKVEKWLLSNTIRLIATAFFTLGFYLQFGNSLEKMTVIQYLEQICSYPKLIGSVVFGILGSMVVAGFAWVFSRKFVGFVILLLASLILGVFYVIQQLRIA